LFDNTAMQPLYILQTGKPGSSYAFEIAQKIGLNKAILQAAKRKIGGQQKRVDTLLVDLERDKKSVNEANVANAQKEKQLVRLQQENEQLQAYLEENKKSILRQAREEARNILQDANRLVENTIAEIKESQADKTRTRALRKQLDAVREGHAAEAAKRPSPKQKTPADTEVRVGDWVKILDTGSEAQVISVAKNNVVLALGELRTVQKRDKVEVIPGKATSKTARQSRQSTTDEVAVFFPEVDVRGMRTEASLYEIKKYLDRAVMMGFPSLKIIHGKGNGILRKFIRDYLRKYGEVTRMEDEHPDRGGEGITYAYLG